MTTQILLERPAESATLELVEMVPSSVAATTEQVNPAEVQALARIANFEIIPADRQWLFSEKGLETLFTAFNENGLAKTYSADTKEGIAEIKEACKQADRIRVDGKKIGEDYIREMKAFPNVPIEVHAGLMAAESVGKYFGEHIKNTKNTDGTMKYPYEKVALSELAVAA